MAAGITLLQVRAQGDSATDADIPQSFALGRRDGVPPAAQELPSVLAKHIGDFQPLLPHLLRPSPSEVSLS